MNKKSQTVRKSRASTDYSEAIIDAAIACFKKYGVAKTTMEDVTQMAQLGRMTVYRTFRTRTDLLDAVALRHMRDIAIKLKPFFLTYKSLEDALVKGSIKIVELSRKDKIFFSIVEQASDRGVEHFLVNPKSPARVLTLELYSDIFAAARKNGEMRDDVTDVEIAAWLRAVHLILFLRDDLDARGQTLLLKRFLLPSLGAK